MGNESSKISKNPLEKFSADDATRLKAGFEIYGKIFQEDLDATDVKETLKSKYPYLSASLISAMKTLLMNVAKSVYSKKSKKKDSKNLTIDLFVWAATADLLLNSSSTLEDKVNLVKSYPSSTVLQDFISDLALGLKILKTTSKLISPGPKPTHNFISFLLSSCFLQNQNQDLDLLFLNTDINSASDQDQTSKQSYHPQSHLLQHGKMPHLVQDFYEWFPRSIYVQRLWKLIFSKIFMNLEPFDHPNASGSGESKSPSSSPSKLPTVNEFPVNVSIYHDSLPNLFGPKSALLTTEDWFMLDTAMDKNQRPKKGFWNNVFSTKTNGNSWTVFSSAIENIGSLLIIIRDKKGRIFGAFSSSELVPKSQFEGNSSNFLFSLNPLKHVYPCTGMNDHYQYFNYRTVTFPNGLGFGGQFDYFGLWIDASFLTGHSKGEPVSSTYGNPPLSIEEEFEVDYVEAWCINEREVDERYEDSKMSALQRNPEAMELLEMSGKKMWSKDLPDKELEEDEE